MKNSERQSDRGSGYIPTLDGWRAVAVLMVIGSHSSRAGGQSWYDGFAVLGVEIFFGISGLLICRRLLDEHERRGHIQLKGFYIRRCTRILPAAWLYLTCVTLLCEFVTNGIRSPREVISCLLIFRNYLPDGSMSWYTGHFWSLMVEEHFYILFPASIVVLGPRRAVWALPVAAFFFLVWRLIDDRTGLLTQELPGVFRTRRSDLRLANLIWGCWLAVLLHRYRGPRWKKLTVSAGCVALALIVADQAGYFPLNGYARGALIPWMLASATLTPDGAIGRFLEWRVLRWVGRISFSLYLWQQLFFVPEPAMEIPEIRHLQRLPWNFAFVFLLASISYYFVERPMIRLGHRLARPATPGRPT